MRPAWPPPTVRMQPNWPVISGGRQVPESCTEARPYSEVMDRSEESTRSYLRESPYTFEGEVEFVQETARYAVRRGWSPYLRWSIYLAAMALGIGLLAAGVGALS